MKDITSWTLCSSRVWRQWPFILPPGYYSLPHSVADVDKEYLSNTHKAPSLCARGTCNRFETAWHFSKPAMIPWRRQSFFFLKKHDVLVIRWMVCLFCSVARLYGLRMNNSGENHLSKCRWEYRSALQMVYMAYTKADRKVAGCPILDVLADHILSTSGVREAAGIPMEHPGITAKELYEFSISTIFGIDARNAEKDHPLWKPMFIYDMYKLHCPDYGGGGLLSPYNSAKELLVHFLEKEDNEEYGRALLPWFDGCLAAPDFSFSRTVERGSRSVLSSWKWWPLYID